MYLATISYSAEMECSNSCWRFS